MWALGLEDGVWLRGCGYLDERVGDVSVCSFAVFFFFFFFFFLVVGFFVCLICF